MPPLIATPENYPSLTGAGAIARPLLKLLAIGITLPLWLILAAILWGQVEVAFA